MILQVMLERLRNGLLSGPGLNARPQASRQRMDPMELAALGGTSPENLIQSLLTLKELHFPAKIPAGNWPGGGEMASWEPEEQAAFVAWRKQGQVLRRLMTIAEDAQEYFNDHGETSLALGFPLLSMPKEIGTKRGVSSRSSRWLAPVAFLPISLQVKMGGRAEVIIRLAGEGERLVEPNTALFALLEQMCGRTLDVESTGDDGSDPWTEILALTKLAAEAAGVALPAINLTDALVAVPKNDDLPKDSLFLSSAVLGLFPMQNLGLMRDMQWMLENESALAAPLRSFLTTKAIASPEQLSLPEVEEISVDDQIAAASPAVEISPHISGAAVASADPFLVSLADPCQADAVKRSRDAEVLVVHGPPGTGKSQTIANIIGDHAARGERVLFVCEKRTALDVVKQRLDAIGLGHLCGVVHDPTTDRREFYMGMRQHLENLSESTPDQHVTTDLQRLDERMAKLRAELNEAFASLHAPSHCGRSFHELVGEWLSHQASATPPPEDLEVMGSFEMEEVEKHHLALDGIALGAERVQFASNPWRNWSLVRPGILAAKSETQIFQSLQKLIPAAIAADEWLTQNVALPASINIPPNEISAVSEMLRKTVQELKTALAGTTPETRQRYLAANAATLATYLDQARRLDVQASSLSAAAMDQGLAKAVPEEARRLPEISARLIAIESWASATGLGRLLRFTKSKPARAALAPLGLMLTDANAARALEFYRGMQARLILNAGLQSEAATSDTWLDDGALSLHWQARRCLAECLHRTLPGQPLEAWRERMQNDLVSESAPELVFSLHAAAERLALSGVWAMEAAESGIFSDTGKQQIAALACSSAPLHPVVAAWNDARATLEDVARIQESLDTLSPALRHAASVCACACASLTPHETSAALHQSALATLLRRLMAERPALGALDGDRLEAAFQSLEQCLIDRRTLARKLAAHTWSQRQRDRLLAATGSRLNSLGAALRQRLYVRGTRALRLRPMIAAGAESEGGDPLFDLCPIWMAGPATVAQILPRQAIFDIVIFDEASQCRLEEALPVMLRAKRLVIAGDPKQLPPTRFFEAGIKDSVDTEAESVEELFEQRQTEAEDLLSAALNLEVEEAFLDVHYRSRDEALIGFSNRSFYHNRLLPIPGHPKNKALEVPIQLHRVDGVYEDRTNKTEAERAVALLADLLGETNPPSVGIACFNLVQRDLVFELMNARAESDAQFATRLALARARKDADSHQGLFVKNLENIQGDERDVIIICTTFGPDPDGKFRRNFGALNRPGGGRRLNVLVTRARQAVHIVTSIPHSEYAALPSILEDSEPNGRYHLYAYLAWAELLASQWKTAQDELEQLAPEDSQRCLRGEAGPESGVAGSISKALLQRHDIGSVSHWGNDGFCVDAALIHPRLPADVTMGLLTDFSRYRRTRDPIVWDLFRTSVLRSQGWNLQRLWSPSLFRRQRTTLENVAALHAELGSHIESKQFLG